MERIVVSMYRKLTLSPVLFFIGFCLAFNGFGQTNWCDKKSPRTNCPDVDNINNPAIESASAPSIIPYTYSTRSNYGTGFTTTSYESYAYIFARTQWATGAIPFRMLKPKNYDAPENANKKYPLVVMFHGAGEYGMDNNYHLLHGGNEHLTAWNNGTYDGFVIFPQGLGQSWIDDPGGVGIYYPNTELKESINLIHYMRSGSGYRVDPDRIFAHGLSAGGSAALLALSLRPDLFAGALILAGNTGINPEPKMTALAAMPIWWFHGSTDVNPAPSVTKTAYNLQRSNGAIDDNKTKYTLFDGRGHDIWPDVYGDPRFFPYINSLSKRKIYVMSPNPVCDGQTGKLGLSPGYASYQWFKDNVLLPGETSSIIQNITTGRYYCRFERIESSGYFYSDTVQMLPIPTITASNELVLPSPANTKVTLSSDQIFDQYLWSNGATTPSIEVNTTGDYNVKGYKNGCWTQNSLSLHVEVGSVVAPPIAPTNLTANAVSPTAALLNWTDNATDEVAYEIYRSQTSGGPYVYIGSTSANSNSYTTASNLLPNTDYYFKVRAVTTFAASLSNEAYTKTISLDLPTPLAPTISFSSLNEQGLTLTWTTPNASYTIRKYFLYYNNELLAQTTNTTYFFGPLTPGNNYSFYVISEDVNGNLSVPGETKHLKYDGAGLFVSKYQVPSEEWLYIPNFSAMTPNSNGWIGTPQLSSTSSSTGITILNKLTNTDLITDKPKDYFGLNFRGYIYIDPSKLGVYSFYNKADNASNLYINGTKVVRNDSTNRDVNVTRWGRYTFTTGGWHPIRIDYYEQRNGQSLVVQYSGPSIARADIPEDVLATTPLGIISTSTTLPSGDLSIVPTDISTSDRIKTFVTVNGSNIANVDYYELYRIKSNSNPVASSVWTKLASFTKTGSGTTFSFTFQDLMETQFPLTYLSPSTKYFYGIKAINRNGEVKYSFEYNLVPYTTPALTISIPATPTALVVTKSSALQKTGSFTDNSNDETGFEVWRSLEQNANYSFIFNLPQNSTSFTDYSAINNVVYYYKVRSYNQEGYSSFSNVDNTLASITTFYSKSTGDLNALSTWGANTDGSGTSPTNFTSDNLTFHYSNRNDETILDAPWTVNGDNSQIIVEAGKKLTVGTGTLNGNLVVEANAEVKFSSAYQPSTPLLESVHATSTLEFANDAVLPSLAQYGNVKFTTTGTKQLPSSFVVKGDLSIGSSSVVGTPSTNIDLTGNLVYTDTLNTLQDISLNLLSTSHNLNGKGGTLKLASLSYSTGAGIHLLENTRLKLGGANGGGLSPGANSELVIGESKLYILEKGALNPSSSTEAKIASTGGSLFINSSTTLASHLYLSATDNTFKEIAVHLPSASLALESSTKLTGTLKLGSGNVQTNDKLILVSNLAGTARIAKVEAAASLSGKVEWQRLLGPDKKQSYMTVASPIADQKVEALTTTISIKGLNGTGIPELSTLNEATNGWTGISNPNTLMVPGKGYRVFVRTADLNHGDNKSAFVSITGLPTIGNGAGSNVAPFVIPLQKTAQGQGWNLIGNPYPCEIDWDASTGWDKTAIDDAYYVWDSKNGIYQSYVNGVGTGTPELSGVINSGQAFMVKAKVSNPTLSLTEEVKASPSLPSKYYRLAETPSLLRIRMTSPDSLNDEAIVRFKKGSTALFDSRYDAFKYKGSSLNISTSAGADELSINTLSPSDPSISIPVNVQSTKGGEFSLSFTGAESFEKEVAVYLHDKEKNTYTNIRNIPNYTFSYSSAFTNKSRFELVINDQTLGQVLDLEEGTTIMEAIQVYPNPASHSATFHFGLKRGSGISLEVYNLNGQVVYNYHSAQSPGVHDTVWEFDKDKIGKGMYFYKVNVDGEIYDGKIVVQ